MKHAIMLAAALLACAWQPAEAADKPLCLVIADAALAAADEGRRGTPVMNVMSAAGDGGDHASMVTRRLFLQAYERGASGESMSQIWEDYYNACQAQQKEERKS